MTPRRQAIVTVLAWNFLAALALTAWVIVIVTHPDQGEDWSGVIAFILIVIGGSAIVLAAGLGVVAALYLMKSRTKAGFGWGTLAAFLGWLVPIVGLVAYSAVQGLAAS